MDRSNWPADLEETFKRWRVMEGVYFRAQFSSFCSHLRTSHAARVDPLVAHAKSLKLSKETWKENYSFEVHRVILDQIATDKKLLKRLEGFVSSLSS